jgi:hypothetical protein
MATTRKTYATKDRPGATEEAPSPAGSRPALLTVPTVFKLRKKKGKKKKKYSRGSKGLQRLAQGTSDALSRSANSLSRGTKTFAKRSKKSSRKKRDGLVRDSLRNASRGVSKGMNELGKAPNEIAKRIGTNQVRRAVRLIVPFGR